MSVSKDLLYNVNVRMCVQYTSYRVQFAQLHSQLYNLLSSESFLNLSKKADYVSGVKYKIHKLKHCQSCCWMSETLHAHNFPVRIKQIRQNAVMPYFTKALGLLAKIMKFLLRRDLIRHSHHFLFPSHSEDCHSQGFLFPGKSTRTNTRIPRSLLWFCPGFLKY